VPLINVFSRPCRPAYRLILPGGQISKILSIPICKNILIFRNPNQVYIHCVHPTEGRIAIVTDAGLDAMDADSALDELCWPRTAKSCGPDTLTPVSSWRRQTADDGGKRARLTGESTKETVKPLRRECRLVPVNLW
jgi:hypothetical protein